MKELELPQGVEFTEKEKAGLQAVVKHLNSQFGDFCKGLISEQGLVDKMAESLKSWGEENGCSKSEMEKLQGIVKSQGAAITAMKEKANNTPQAQGLKGAFDREFDNLKSAIKDRKAGFVIKAVSEHDGGKIITTGAVTTTTGASLFEGDTMSNELFMKRKGVQYIHDIANVTRVAEVPENYSFYEEGSEDGSIAIVAENGLKPMVNLKLIKNHVEPKKAAGYITVTEEMMKYKDIAWGHIQRLFSDKVWRDYEKLLTADLMANASAYVSTPLDDTIAEPTDFEAIIAGVLQLESLNYQPDVLVINPADKWKLAMSETKNGTLILPYIQNGGQFGLLGLRVITTTEIEAGTFVLGESSAWYVQEEAPQLRTGLVNDDFIHNRMTILGEIFFLSFVPSNNAGAFLKATFASVKEALKK